MVREPSLIERFVPFLLYLVPSSFSLLCGGLAQRPLDLPDIAGDRRADLTAPQFHRVLRQAEIIHHAATRLATA